MEVPSSQSASPDDLGEEEIDFSTGTYRGVVSEEDVDRQIQQDRATLPPPIDDREVIVPGLSFTTDLELSPSEQLLRQFIAYQNFSDHHIKGYDNWISHSAAKNIYSYSIDMLDGRVVFFEKLRIFPPQYTRGLEVCPLTPSMAREQGVTYGCDWYIDVVMRNANGEEIERRTDVCIGTIPCMLKSHYCILRGKSPRQLALLGEDPNDPGGYFIVSGVEKVILLQEKLALNRIMLMVNKKAVVVRFTPNTYRGTVLIELILDKSKSMIKIRLPSMKGTKKKNKDENADADSKKVVKSINVFRIFRLLGIDNIDDIQELIGLFIKPEWLSMCLLKLTRNIADYQIRPNDVEVIAAKMNKENEPDSVKKNLVKVIVENDLFPHINDLAGPHGETRDERLRRIRFEKLYLLSAMIAPFTEYLAGYRSLDDPNKWGGKRAEGAGRMMMQLLRNAWRKTLDNVRKGISVVNGIPSGSIFNLDGITEKLQYGIITETFRESFINTKWGVKRKQMQENVAQTLSRDSIIMTYAHITTVDVNIFRRDRQQNIRNIQNDQWGYICPVSTPEGENVGLVKATAITAKVSLERDDHSVIRLLIGDEEKGITNRVAFYYRPGDRPPTRAGMATYYQARPQNYDHKLLVNGKFLGWCDGPATRTFLLDKRRNGELYYDISLVLEGGYLHVDMSPSRLIRPLLIVSDKRLVLDAKNLRGQPIPRLMAEGALEYLSPWEQEQKEIKVAPNVQAITDRENRKNDLIESVRKAKLDLVAFDAGEEVKIGKEKVTSRSSLEDRIRDSQSYLDKFNAINHEYTHCELDDSAILGVAASTIPWPNHNQAPRNVYQVAMGKQALGVYHANHANRFDGKMKVLAFPQRAMVESNTYDILGLNERGSGENINIAFMSYPFNEEDSFVVKKEFLDNGGFRIYRYFTRKTTIKRGNQIEEKLVKPKPSSSEPPGRYKYIYDGGEGDPNNGLPMIGAPLKQGECVIGKIQYVKAPGVNEIRNESVFLRVGDQGIVDKVLVTSDNLTTTVTVKLRTMRVPEEGDKFAPRNAQKGTVGLVVSDIDLPFDENGLVPDFIVNPLSLVSRMTISYLIEMMATRAGAIRGHHINGGAFRPARVEEHGGLLQSRGEDKFGYAVMRSGTSGKLLDNKINAGPVFFQALKHHVRDKIQARNSGAVKSLTRQPPKGRNMGGGIRFGEMERDAGISHGASAFILERLKMVSDKYQVVFCLKCGAFAIYDALNDKYRPCRLCDNETEFGRYIIPYAYKLLIHLLGAMGINLRPKLISGQELLTKVLRGRGDLLRIEDPSQLQQVLQNELDDQEDEVEEEVEEEEVVE